MRRTEDRLQGERLHIRAEKATLSTQLPKHSSGGRLHQAPYVGEFGVLSFTARGLLITGVLEL